MKLKKVWRNVLILIVIAAFIPIIIFLLVRLTPQPPIGEVEYAREILSKANENHASTYSGKLFNEAKVLYDSAMVNWQKENKKFLYFRDYDNVARFAELSAKKGEQAMVNSKISYSNLQIKTKHKIDSLNSFVVNMDKRFTAYPLSAEIRNRISKGKMLLKESEIAFKKGQYLHANRKMTDSEYLLTSSFENATTNLSEYFKSFPVWKKWADWTLKESRQTSSYSIIIDKFSRKCFVYLKGVKKYEYNVELGSNWVGDKREKGDKATPEGMYKIIKKFEKSKTKYYKALLLDYPNETDREEFKQKIANGTLPASAKIGELIEIHGTGGRGIDWTEGCVALTDSEMDVIYKIADVGTPVTIVGSLIDLQDVLER